jgi:hypothetical protein
VQRNDRGRVSCPSVLAIRIAMGIGISRVLEFMVRYRQIQPGTVCGRENNETQSALRAKRKETKETDAMIAIIIPT